MPIRSSQRAVAVARALGAGGSSRGSSAPARSRRARSRRRPGRARRPAMFSSQWVSSTQAATASGSSRVMPHVRLLLVGQLDAEALAARSARAGPSSGAGWSRCPARSEPRRCTVETLNGSGLPSRAKPAPRRGPPRRADESTARPRSRTGAGSTGAEHLHQIEIDGARSTTSTSAPGDGPADRLHPRPRRLLAELAREHPPRRARSRRVIALDLPGFGLSEMPRDEISIPGYGRMVDRSATGSGSARSCWSATRWAASSPRRWRSGARSAVERLVLVSAAGITSASSTAPGAILGPRGAWRSAPTAPRTSSGTIAPRRGCATSRSRWSRATHAPAPDLCWELMKRRRQARLHDALRALLDYDFRERLAEIGCPTLIVWGADDMLVPVRGRRRVRAR